MIKAPTVEVQEALGTQRPGISLLDSHPASAPGVQVCLSVFTQPALNSCSPPREQHLHLLLESSGHLLQAVAAPGRTRCSKCKPPTPRSAKLSAGCGHVASGGRSGTSPGAQFKTAVHMDTVQNRRIA